MRLPAGLLAFMAVGASLAGCGRKAPAFTDVTAKALPGFVQTFEKAGLERGLPSGGALALFDADGDGRPDLYVARASGRREDSSDLLLLNNGDGAFRDATKTAGIAGAGFGLGAAAADYDNDGRVDLYVTNRGGGALYHNDGNGAFTDVTAKAGLGGGRLSLGAVFADLDCSGALDLVVPFFAGAKSAGILLFKNNGNGTFTEAGAGAGITGLGAHGAAFVSDFDHDRDADILVAGMDGGVAAYLNDRPKGFKEDSRAHGLGAAWGARGLVAEDFDNDRYRDLFALSTGCALNRLFGRKGYGPYQEAGPGRTDLGRGGTHAAALDFDNDGWLDLLISGACRTGAGGFLLLRNRADGGFDDAAALLPIPEPEQGTAGNFALADYDGDGDADIFLIRDGVRVTVLRNDVGNKNRWVGVELKGRQGSGKDGFGAKVEVKAGELWVERELTGANGGSSQAPAPLLFGLGKRDKADLVRVTWPTGIRQSLVDVPAGQTVRVTEKRGRPAGHAFIEVVEAR
ncbi:MAG: CRTAC1 family protein [Elusimicrobia bacterium]|nr:CRTAC1 family protein [Elusimicrobiota bacterium]